VVITEVLQPAPAADAQNADSPAPGAEEKKPEAEETPEQIEAKHESRRARSNARKAQQLADARAEAKFLRERLEKLEAQPKADEGAAEPKRTDINPATGQEYTFEEHLERRADWRADQRVEARLKAEREASAGKEKQLQATAGSEKAAQDWVEREKTFQAATKDYEEVVNAFLDDEMKSFSNGARAAIVESEVGPALLYHLAQHPEDAERIADLSPLGQIRELGKLELKVSMPAKRTTNAPEPAKVNTGGKTAASDLDRVSQAEYEAKRKAQGARWAR